MMSKPGAKPKKGGEQMRLACSMEMTRRKFLGVMAVVPPVAVIANWAGMPARWTAHGLDGNGQRVVRKFVVPKNRWQSVVVPGDWSRIDYVDAGAEGRMGFWDGSKHVSIELQPGGRFFGVLKGKRPLMFNNNTNLKQSNA